MAHKGGKQKMTHQQGIKSSTRHPGHFFLHTEPATSSEKEKPSSVRPGGNRSRFNSDGSERKKNN